jgi:hypothetical protein
VVQDDAGRCDEALHGRKRIFSRVP